ncbi:hypothetical protein MATL_G00164480 [Megalops atlanticus]|uniref:C-type lectin domain-containing protein n=1 Tax=Megalops atlanticus TaxID=7932 RepID=A0A9D3T2H7_MEGAT|nr:hypothetical protein MATL_G00164480 [Megalops atlanticus]
METSGENKFEGIYSKLIGQDDNELSIDGQSAHTTPETQHKVSVFTLKDGPSTNAYRLATWSLGILCALLMAAIVALCTSYKELSAKHDIQSQNSSEISSILEQLRANYSALAASKEQLQGDYRRALSIKDNVQEDRDRERQEKERLQKEKQSLETAKTKLQERISNLEKSCGHCPVGWDLFNSTCYYVAPSDTSQRMTWALSREECRKLDADLVVLDTLEKQEFISGALQIKGPRSPHWHTTGYWIGLRDIETEGVWKWRNGAPLTTGYWFDGEPNDYHEAEDCAATYPKENPLKTWNDAPCGYKLKWICEKELKET